MKELIYVDIVEENAVVSLDTIIKFSKNSEKSVKELVSKYEEDIMDFQIPFETESSTNLKLPRSSSGMSIKWSKVKLQEAQAYFLLSLMNNSSAVVSFKKALVKDFFKAKEILMSSKAIFDAEQLEHIKQFMPDMSQYGKLVEKTGLAKVKLVKGYYRTDKHNKLSRLVGERIRLEHRLGGLFDEEIQIQIDALNEVIAKVGSEIEVERLAKKALTNIK